MLKQIFFSLFLLCSSLYAAQLTMDLDSTWEPVEYEGEEYNYYDCLDSKEYEQFFERVSEDARETIFLVIGSRYLMIGETIANFEGVYFEDSIETTFEEICADEDTEIKIHYFDESTSLVEEWRRNNEDKQEIMLWKSFLSPTHCADIIYTYSGKDLSKCDTEYWLNYIDQMAEFIDDEQFPEVQFAIDMDLTSWTEIKDESKFGRTWDDGNGFFRCVFFPLNIVSDFGNLDGYLENMINSYRNNEDMYLNEGGACEIIYHDKNVALTEQISTGGYRPYIVEKVTWTPDYVASVSYCSYRSHWSEESFYDCTLKIPTEEMRRKWIDFIDNKVKIVDGKG